MKWAALSARWIMLLLAPAAIVIHAPSLTEIPSPSDFSQGAYRPLLAAEQKLQTGEAQSAVNLFQIAAMRAYRCGRTGVFERIRFRLGSAGKEMMQRSGAKGWPLLAAYALWSPNFRKAARKAELYVLSRSSGIHDFDYPLVISSSRTSFGDMPDKASLWLYRRMSAGRSLNGLPGLLYGSFVKNLPATGSMSLCFPIGVRAYADGTPVTLKADSGGPRAWRGYASLYNVIQWDTPMVPDQNGRASLSMNADRTWAIDRLLVVADDVPKTFHAELEYHYEPLP